MVPVAEHTNHLLIAVLKIFGGAQILVCPKPSK